MSGRGRGRIRAPRRAFTKDEVDCEQIWAVLDKAFREIHGRNASNLSYEELFRNAYKLVLKKKGDFLFENVKKLEIEHLDNTVKAQIRSLATPTLLLPNVGADVSSNERRQSGERFMAQLTKAFNDHSQEAGMITDVLMYMDRISTSEGRKSSIYAVALGLFRERVLQAKANDDLHYTILELLETVMLEMIQLEREGEIIERPLIRASCRMLENLYQSLMEEESTRLYLVHFEPHFLEASRDFYRNEGVKLVQEADATTFCSQARQRLKEEEERCQQCLSMATDQKIRLVVEQELVGAHIADVINLPGTGVRNMLDNDKMTDLLNMYELVKRVDPRLKHLKDAVHKRIQELGTEINNGANHIATQMPTRQKEDQKEGDAKGKEKEKPAAQKLNQATQAAINWVEDVLKLKAKYDKVLLRAFKSDAVMEKALEISFQDFINSNPRSPEFVSLFLDQYLKSGIKDRSEAEIDLLLDSGVTLVQYLADKDVLETYYHKHMAKRLLMGKSVSRDVERQMLSKMKMRLGNQFTAKMEGLLKDIELSENLTSGYREHVQRQDIKPKIEFEPSILTTTVWPITIPEGADKPAILPPEVAKAQESFERYYHSKHTGRKLTWLPHMGDVTMRVTYEKNGKPIVYEVTGPTYCMIVLMLFNEHERLTCDQIQQMTNIPADKVVQTLLSVAVAPKTRLLRKEPMTRDVNPTDVFSYNEKFEHAYRKFKVALVSDHANKVETVEQRKETQKKADDMRGLVIDAAIVKVMKARKTLSHQQLISETIDILKSRFQPDVGMIKKKIESLIERDYLERGSDASNPSYNYLA
ncbi:hypothetical protein LTR64_003095 [Lithohypha guttulata]|uniref:Cullin family profile domain-containing protein n=1 Tax=Lithohypha guttulata TaxID=1690604 RepID=A0AAN7T135_9EURO|nr:hypothetical protein LTR51_000683 [Lithohypha guttulata]KAK5085870.1 hypothetical protein LTR05_005159 [Lithohypha guttulata]